MDISDLSHLNTKIVPRWSCQRTDVPCPPAVPHKSSCRPISRGKAQLERFAELSSTEHGVLRTVWDAPESHVSEELVLDVQKWTEGTTTMFEFREIANKLAGRGLLTYKDKKDERVYRITPKGRTYID